jgi:membrane protease YdiL (CAAX protease family)
MRQKLDVLIVVVTVAVSTSLAFRLERASTLSFWLLLGLPTVGLSLVAAVRAFRHGELSDWLRPAWGDFSRGFLGAALLVVAAWGFAQYVASAGTPREAWLARVYLQLGDPKDLRANVGLVGAAVLAFAFAEEVLWRGFVTSRLEEIVGSRKAVVIASLAYATAYAPTVVTLRDPIAGPNPALVLFAALGGALWGTLARRSGRLIPAAFSHALAVWALLMMFRLWGAPL